MSNILFRCTHNSARSVLEEAFKAHWGYPDPSKVEGPEAVRLAAFELTRQALAYRLRQLVDLPLATMGDASLRAALAEITAS